MNRTRFLSKLFLYTLLSLTAVEAIGGTVAIWCCFDEAVGYFDTSPLTVVCTVLAIAALAVCALLPLTIPKDTLPVQWPNAWDAPTTRVWHGLSALLLVGSAVLSFVSAVDPQSVSSPAFSWGIALTALLSASYMVVTALRVSERAPVWLTALGVAPILWSLLIIAKTYTDLYTTMNSPIKLAIQLGCACIMLMTTADLRFRLNRPLPRLALTLYGLATFFGLGAGVVLTVTSASVSDIRGYALGLLAISLCSVKRLADYIFSQDRPSDVSEETPSADTPS